MLIFSSYISLQHMKGCREKATERVNWLIDLEMFSFSLSTQYLANYRVKFLALYKGAREKYENPDLIRLIKNYDMPTGGSGPVQLTGIAKAMTGLSEIGLWQRTFRIFYHQIEWRLPSESWQMSSRTSKVDPRCTSNVFCLLYILTVAIKRFTDNVPLAIDSELVRCAEKGMLQLIYSPVNFDTASGMQTRAGK